MEQIFNKYKHYLLTFKTQNIMKNFFKELRDKNRKNNCK